ncbi:hypothetical protein HLB44_25195 [Aquincola sp. S2]|uniref:Ig-like domain-containing protein n=1 Tax=Pseudaquabacterium terrae TaxID=2732868 RepID=A0ABX2ENT5_9BURK|nr:hypothetical protein [Aquabacterium terrae]NRF70310.1 hypothetical protein [Aquabacterium terrae]
MRPTLIALATTAVVGSLAGGHAAAQVQTPPPPAQAIRILVSEPLRSGNWYVCTVANVSASPVTLSQYRFDSSSGAIYEPSTCGATPVTLEPGRHCFTSLRLSSLEAGLASVACRIRHSAGENAVLGSLQGFVDGPGTAPYLIGVSQLRWIGATAAP